MITEDSFAQLMHELGDVDAPPSEARLTGIQSKIKRVRVRRTLTAAVAVIAIVAAGVAFATLRGGPPAVPASVPRSWTADDGVVYKLIKYVTLDTAHQKSLVVSVPATSPITIRFTCAADSPVPNDPQAPEYPAVEIGSGRYTLDTLDQARLLLCHEHASNVADYDQTRLPATGGVAHLTISGQQTGAGAMPEVFPARWTFAVYTWVIPKVLRPVPTLPPPPTFDGYRLVSTLTASWPREPSVTFHLPANVTWGIVFGCSDALRGNSPYVSGFTTQSTFQTIIDGKADPGATVLDCEPSADEGPAIVDADPVGRTVTITFDLASMYRSRINVIQVGVYYATN